MIESDGPGEDHGSFSGIWIFVPDSECLSPVSSVGPVNHVFPFSTQIWYPVPYIPDSSTLQSLRLSTHTDIILVDRV